MQRRSRDRNVRAFEFMIRNEKKIRDAVEEARANKGGHTGGTPTGHTRISDPTAGEAIRNVEELSFVEIEGGGRVEWPERWLSVIDAVRAWCESDGVRREILKRRYGGESYVVTCREVHISSRVYHDVLYKIRVYAVQCAAQMQVIKVF